MSLKITKITQYIIHSNIEFNFRETSSYSHYLVSKENDKINGIFPLMIKDGPLGKIINSLPYFEVTAELLRPIQQMNSLYTIMNYLYK